MEHNVFEIAKCLAFGSGQNNVRHFTWESDRLVWACVDNKQKLQLGARLLIPRCQRLSAVNCRVANLRVVHNRAEIAVRDGFSFALPSHHFLWQRYVRASPEITGHVISRSVVFTLARELQVNDNLLFTFLQKVCDTKHYLHFAGIHPRRSTGTRKGPSFIITTTTSSTTSTSTCTSTSTTEAVDSICKSTSPTSSTKQTKSVMNVTDINTACMDFDDLVNVDQPHQAQWDINAELLNTASSANSSDNETEIRGSGAHEESTAHSSGESRDSLSICSFTDILDVTTPHAITDGSSSSAVRSKRKLSHLASAESDIHDNRYTEPRQNASKPVLIANEYARYYPDQGGKFARSRHGSAYTGRSIPPTIEIEKHERIRNVVTHTTHTSCYSRYKEKEQAGKAIYSLERAFKNGYGNDIYKCYSTGRDKRSREMLVNNQT